MHEAMAEVLTDPAVRAQIEGKEADVVAAGPAGTRAFLANEITRLGRVIREHGIRIAG